MGKNSFLYYRENFKTIEIGQDTNTIIYFQPNSKHAQKKLSSIFDHRFFVSIGQTWVLKSILL